MDTACKLGGSPRFHALQWLFLFLVIATLLCLYFGTDIIEPKPRILPLLLRQNNSRFFNSSIVRKNGHNSNHPFLVFNEMKIVPLNNRRTQNLAILSVLRDPRVDKALVALIIGPTDLRSGSFFCHLMHLGATKFTSAPTNIRRMDWYGGSYVGYIIHCPTGPAGIYRWASHLTLSLDKMYSNNAGVPIIDIPVIEPNQSTIASCVAPLHGPKLSVANLVAWVEMNRMLGVSHFLFYNYSAPASLNPFFRYYTSTGIVSVRQWHTAPIPTAEMPVWPPMPNKLHYFGQVSAYNDCLYRLTGRYRYLMFIDIDELIIPEVHDRLNELLTKLDEPSGTPYGAFIFSVTNLLKGFPKEPTTANNTLVKTKHILFLERTYAEDESRFKLPKFIVRGHKTKCVQVHSVIDGYPLKILKVNPSDAKLMHYRMDFLGSYRLVKAERQLALVKRLPNLIKLVKRALRFIESH